MTEEEARNELRGKLIASLKDNPGARFVTNVCSVCGYPCGFSSINGGLYFDSGCYCVRLGPNLNPRSWLDLEFYLDPSHGHIPTIESLIADFPPSDATFAWLKTVLIKWMASSVQVTSNGRMIDRKDRTTVLVDKIMAVIDAAEEIDNKYGVSDPPMVKDMVGDILLPALEALRAAKEES